MKRSFALLSAATLTTIVAIFVLISILAALASPINANQIDMPEQAPLTDIEVQGKAVTTAEAVHLEVLATLSEREKLLQDQVVQLEEQLTELDDESQLQLDQQKARLLEIQAQSNQVSANITGLQAQIAAIQQAMEVDNQNYEAELAGMVNSTSQLQQQLETANGQLAEAYNRLAQQQAEAMIPWQDSIQNQTMGNSSRSHDDDHHEKDDDDDHEAEDHDENHHEDDDDDHHEAEDDDDD